MAKDPTWDEAIQVVLKNAKGALHYTEIADRIANQKLKQKVGATPANTVAAVISGSLHSDDSPYQRVARGEYALKDTLQEAPPETEAINDAVTQDAGALRAFGMYWQRDLVLWTGKPRLLGRQGPNASDANFAEQIGVYLLHDRDRVIYVGRASDTLFKRLQAHTTDRLGGRWDRFSWFGLRSVNDDGSLGEPSTAWEHGVVIETMEALLIESLEPPLNRKRGDNFSAAEYLQVADPDIDSLKKKQLLSELITAAGIKSLI
jgi:hypothetical protein